MKKNELVEKLREKIIQAEEKYRNCEDRFQFEDYFQGFADGLSDAIGIILEVED